MDGTGKGEKNIKRVQGNEKKALHKLWVGESTSVRSRKRHGCKGECDIERMQKEISEGE